MSKPAWVTFTGVDDRTDLKRLEDLSLKYPIEWGILVGGRLGKTRYPSQRRIKEFCELACNRSLHLCGSYASKVLKDHGIGGHWDLFNRVQVNAVSYDMDHMSQFSSFIGRPVIIQVRGKFPQREGLHFLHDASGGRGKTGNWPEAPSALNGSMYGFAGGINPDNVLSLVETIRCESPYWIDMETGVRTDDWFDLDKCEAVCKSLFGK